MYRIVIIIYDNNKKIKNKVRNTYLNFRPQNAINV